MYGRIVDAAGRIAVRDADADMAVPSGGKFVPAPMKYFMRFDGATGMHAGILPGYPASHGCVRMPRAKAILFFNIVPIGAPVHVFGIPPERKVAKSARPLAKPSPTAPPTAVPPHPGFFQSLFGRPPATATPPPRRYPN